jgi:hypothetical protein
MCKWTLPYFTIGHANAMEGKLVLMFSLFRMLDLLLYVPPAESNTGCHPSVIIK